MADRSFQGSTRMGTQGSEALHHITNVSKVVDRNALDFSVNISLQSFFLQIAMEHVHSTIANNTLSVSTKRKPKAHDEL
jgi:alpha-D-ribose 1-methylphosphonate 5-phosphate C-P lyase